MSTLLFFFSLELLLSFPNSNTGNPRCIQYTTSDCTTTNKVVYSSGSQPFGLQVPVKDNFLSYCPGQIFFIYCVPELCVLWTKKHQLAAKFA